VPLARACLLSLAACGASASSRPVTATTGEFTEVEKAAQPSSTPPPGTTTVPSPDAGSATSTTGTDALANSTGPMVFGLLDGEAALEDAWDRWNAGKTTTYDQVFEIAVLANRSRPLAMSDELMVIALARAVEMSNCDSERLGRIRLLAIAVSTSPHTEELDSELGWLADVGPIECAKRK
jgi:hypothetical protein